MVQSGTYLSMAYDVYQLVSESDRNLREEYLYLSHGQL